MKAGYHDHERQDVLELIPREAKRVLDLGCGTGRLGAAVKARQECDVWGIEGDEEACELSGRSLDGAICKDLDDGLPKSDLLGDSIDGEFDCIVAADVLEHLREPERVLRDCRELLAKGGTLIVSIPNLRNADLLAQLVEGDFEYTEAGLLDRTHVHLFTRRSLQIALWRAHFQPASVNFVHLTTPKQGLQIGVGRLHLGAWSTQEARELQAYQVLLTAGRRERPTFGLTSIVIPVYNQLAFTQQCVRSVQEHTDAEWTPYEIIIVDNGSGDGTGEWLRETASSPPCPPLPARPSGAGDEGGTAKGNGEVRYLRRVENEGFAKACNRGAEAARGENIVFLNNDTLVCEGWLERLVGHLTSPPDPLSVNGEGGNGTSPPDPLSVNGEGGNDNGDGDGEGRRPVGLVGAVSNSISGAQQVNVPYSEPWQAPGFGFDLGLNNAGRNVETKRLTGFCLAAKREVFWEVGGFDEQFGLGTYEDDDLCRRYSAAGYRLLIAGDCFVHHYGSQTFRGEGIDMNALMVENRARFEAKWDAQADGREVREVPEGAGDRGEG